MSRKTTCMTIAALLLLLAPLPAASQESDVRKEIEDLKKGQEQIRKDLAEIKRLLQARPAPAPAPRRPAAPDVEGKVFELGDNPVHGEATAGITLIEFTDFQCGFCARHHRDTFPRLMDEYVKTGKIRYASLDLPLQMHRLAFKAAEAAHCAGDQGQYWEMHDRLFANQRALEPWSGHAEALGLDVEAFDECMESGKHADGVRKDMTVAREAGASGTPSFVLGKTDPEDASKVIGIQFVRGAQPFAVFQEAIDGALE